MHPYPWSGSVAANPMLRPRARFCRLRPQVEEYGPRPVGVGSYGFLFFLTVFLFPWFTSSATYFVFSFSKQFSNLNKCKIWIIFEFEQFLSLNNFEFEQFSNLNFFLVWTIFQNWTIFEFEQFSYLDNFSKLNNFELYKRTIFRTVFKMDFLKFEQFSDLNNFEI
jgi:hypothetical protein